MDMLHTIAHAIAKSNSARYNSECYALPVSTIREIRLQRLQLLLSEHKGIKKLLGAAIGKAPSQVSQWINGTRTITEETAREIERSVKKPTGWMDLPIPSGSGHITLKQVEKPPHEGDQISFLLDESTVTPITKPPRLNWEDLLTETELPTLFELTMPDDSMEPFTPRGTVLVLCRGASPVPGHGILVRNAGGEMFIRMYQQGPAGRWIAQPRNQAYAALDSERDELQIIATVTGRMSGLM